LEHHLLKQNAAVCFAANIVVPDDAAHLGAVLDELPVRKSELPPEIARAAAVVDVVAEKNYQVEFGVLLDGEHLPGYRQLPVIPVPGIAERRKSDFVRDGRSRRQRQSLSGSRADQ
jgi:DNA-dependent RNA polymerase auxiliary subunit epsilon